MGKKSRAKTNKTAHKIKPDETYTRGPLSITRAGKNLILSNNMSEKEHQELLSKFKERHTEIISDLKTKIGQLQTLVSLYDPVELMHRAAYMLMNLMMKYKSEADYPAEETLNLPSVEYLQYLISRTQSDIPKKKLQEDEWNTLWKITIDILTLTREYIFTRPTKNSPPDEIDELRFFLDNRRLSVRVERYSFFLEAYWKNALLPYEAWIVELYGINVQSLVTGLQELHNYQKHGLTNRYMEMFEAISQVMEMMSEKGYEVGPTDLKEETEKTQKALESDEFNTERNVMKDKINLALTPELFDITTISTLPIAILDALSVQPGEAIETDLDSKDDISPLSTSVLHYRPFLKVNNRYYHFLHTGFIDHIAEIIEQDLLAKKPEAENSMMHNRGKMLEDKALELIAKITEPDLIYSNLFYPDPDNPAGLTELDGLIIVDDVLFLVEGKAGKFSEAASRGAPTSLLKDLKNLIVEGQRQSERAEFYMKSKEEISFYDSSGKNVICKIKHSLFRKIFRIIVTREPLGWIGAKIARLSILDKTILNEPPWHVSLDDLMAVADVFESRGPQFCHYLEQRLKVAEDNSINIHDEIDHIGVYLERNQYYLSEILGAGNISYNQYGKEIDIYFAKKYEGLSVEPLQQYLPPNLKMLIDSIAISKLKLRYEVLNFILSFSKEGRDDIETRLLTLLERYKDNKRLSIRFPLRELNQGMSITLCNDDDLDTEKARSGYLLKTSECASWLILQLSSPFVIQKIIRLKLGDIPKEQLLEAQNDMNSKILRKLNTKGEKIGRNDYCPCGSGKKYKYCHGKPT